MTNKTLFFKGITTLALLAAIPHLFAMTTDYGYSEATNYFSELWSESEIEYWFSLANDGSLFYIIIPFFILELIRYTFMKRMNWNLFAYYWDHRLMHRIGLGWATHTVHHSSPHFNMSVAYRFGPLDAIFPILFSLPLVMLGFNPWLLLAAELFVQTYQAILHTEVIGKLPKPIEYIFNTPSHHRVHHGVNEQYWDRNYAGIFIIWDRMFGTFTEEKEKVLYGVSEPLDSVNPMKVFFHGFTRLFRDMSKTKGLKNKLAFLIKPPGWKPEN